MLNAGACVTLCALNKWILLLTWLFEEATRRKHIGFEESNYLKSCIIGSQPKDERENIKKITHSSLPSHANLNQGLLRKSFSANS